MYIYVGICIFYTDFSLIAGITVVIIIGVALLICISTLIVGLIHLKR